MEEPWPENAGQHCVHWYENEECCWCKDPPSDTPELAEETPCPANENGERE